MTVAAGRVPGLGHALALARGPMRFIQGLRAQGDVVTFYLGTTPIHQINSPELIRRVLVTDAHRFGRGQIFAKARQLFGDGLATADEPAHMRQRRIMQPAFHRDRMAAYVDIMRSEMREFVDSWRPGHVVRLDREISQLTLAVTAKALFRADLGTAAVSEVCRSLGPILNGVTKRAMVPDVYERIPTPGNRRFDAGLRRLTTIVDEVIKAYRESGTDHGDLLSMLVASEMTDTEVRTQVMNILMAGTDTTAITLSWAFHELAADPAVRHKVFEEVDTVLGGRPVTAADIPRLLYVERVVAETVRMHTPVWLLMRKAISPVTLGDVTLAPGAQVMISMPALHRDPALFTDPLRFDPDRWLDPRASEWPKAGVLVPFGAGRHRCIGEAFALAEMITALVTVCQNWELLPVPGHRVREVARAFLRPNALLMTVQRR
ncbi:cytochrome P450 [Kibdelosporangium philippinense]|uniref:Cytochrome P450 n=1 Tax=Kibdelosporangium philippinense TaxID=211113 RepID=A0ABS8ZJ15_9PSEU|nr:cytochrome P450 [Kibdelosporangium philippinense]MCE7007547.1 cytochrome P450 [Kibdelosporangium philippinense]